MRNSFLTVVGAQLSLALFSVPRAYSSPCPAGTTFFSVATTTELEDMMTSMNCTGEGVFDVTWIGSVPLVETIEVSNQKSLTVSGSSLTGAASDRSSSDSTDIWVDVIDAGGGTGIFRVSNGSTLSLNNLMLEGGISETGAAIDVRSSSSVYVDGCVFKSNNATTGGAIYAFSSEIHIFGDTSFTENSAEDDGGAIFVEHSEIRVDGTISFANNSAGNEGGAVHASSSELDVVGETYFGYNSVGSSGGALFVYNCSTYMSGITTFVHHSAGGDGGAVSASESKIYVNGNSSFVGNSAGEEGGAVFAESSDVRVEGKTSFADNSAGDTGGAISSSTSNITMDGWTSMANNSAVGNGGAIYAARDSIVYISGESESRYNSAGEHGGVVCVRTGKMHVDGSNVFTDNTAVERGGALISLSSEVYISGSVLFTHNDAQDNGGAVAWIGSEVDISGDTSFAYNSAKAKGGAMFSGNSNVRMVGQTWFGYNSASSFGGAVQGHTALISMEGNTTFVNNTAKEDGGALEYYTGEGVDIVGITTFYGNTAKWRGGALSIVSAAIRITGNTSFAHNTGYDGGAIVAYQSPLVIGGNTTFVGNKAGHDGGALNILGANATIMGDTQFVSNTALNGGAIFSALSPNFEVHGVTSFVANQAKFYGGAISLTDPVHINIIDATFESNTATSGGAVSLTSTEGTSGGYENCRFGSNDASNGGALYLSTGGTGEVGGLSFVQHSAFHNNVAAELGGALFNAGALTVNNTVFVENTAGEGGLAIHDEGSDIVLKNVTFHGNTLSCPSQQYTDAHDSSDDACRFELVCQHCPEGCDVDPSVAKVTLDTIPVCEEIPQGVLPSSTTLATFDLLEGYYRVSDESRVIRECYQTEACEGGIDHLNYCATGFTGPYCAVCAEGYAPGVLSSCHECSTDDRRWTVGLGMAALSLAVLVVVVMVTYTLRGRRGEGSNRCSRNLKCCQNFVGRALPLSAIKIVVVVIQITTQFAEIAGAVYPDEYEAFLSNLTAINLDIGLFLSSSCIVTTDFYDRLLFATVGPAIVLLILFGTLFMARRRQSNHIEATTPLLQHKRASTGLFILFFVYSAVSFTIFQTFVCDELDDGNSYLRADYSLHCSTQKHTVYRTYASVMVCVYPVGIPAFFGWWLARNRHDLAEPRREEIPHLKAFRGLWDAYSPSCYYYEVVECCRRIVLTGAAVFVLPNSVEQIAIIFLLAVVFTFISESLSPFATKTDMWLYRWGNAIILASMYVALILKAGLTDADSSSSSAMTVLLIAANVFLVVTVVMQAVLLVRGLYKPTVVGQAHATVVEEVHASRSWYDLSASMEENFES